jgi:hypothetical protein
MINNFYLEDFYAFSSHVAGACTYGSDDMLSNQEFFSFHDQLNFLIPHVLFCFVLFCFVIYLKASHVSQNGKLQHIEEII